MKKTFLLPLLLACCGLCHPDGGGTYAQTIPFIKADQIQRWKTAGNDTIYVLNFWATWCEPCVAELPAFQVLATEFADRPVRVVLISMDFKRQVESKVQPFVQERNLGSLVVYLDEPTPNTWINAVNPDWSGAIPATLLVAPEKGREQFFEQKLTYEVLKKALLSLL